MMMSTTMTMALTPLLAVLGDYVANYGKQSIDEKSDYIMKETSDIHDHVIIVGFGNTGKILANICISEYIYYVAIDISPLITKNEKENGMWCIRAMRRKLIFLKMLGLSGRRMS